MRKSSPSQTRKVASAKPPLSVNLGIGLAKIGKSVIIDADPQGSATIHLGHQQPDMLTSTLAELLHREINDAPYAARDYILTHAEGVGLITANRNVTNTEATLTSTMSGEIMLRECVSQLRESYDYILIDCLPSPGVLSCPSPLQNP